MPFAGCHRFSQQRAALGFLGLEESALIRGVRCVISCVLRLLILEWLCHVKFLSYPREAPLL